ncbi:MAG: aspartate dehydrogenase [Candidatus Thermoplasmatota archaeon]|nr:aspartate dehydrogenase [Candidatus Thermoplasmatota archaeon]
MRVLVIGCGAIGKRVAEASEGLAKVKRVFLYDVDHARAQELASRLSKARAVDSVEEVADVLHFAVEAASAEALKEYAPLLLEHGVSLLVMSVGGFVDEDFRVSMDQLALANNAKIYIPSGAIAGLDGLLSLKEAPVHRVSLVTRKPKKTIQGLPWVVENNISLSDTEPTVVFQGPASEAVLAFPMSVNVAAALSIAGIGFHETKVTFISDPSIDRNIHHIEMEGDAGKITIECENVPSPENPRTSYLAALSAVAAVHRIEWGYRFV